MRPADRSGRIFRLFEGPAAALLIYFLLAAVWMGPPALHPLDTISDVGDPLHLAYIMAWNAHQLIRDPAHLFDANSFYPWKQSLAFADHLLPESILVAPVQWVTGNAVLAYNLAVFAGLVLSASFMRLLILEVTGHAGAALLAGVAYGFNGFTLMEVDRVQVIHMQWWPLALLCLCRFVEGPTFGRAMGVSAALALQGLSGSYYLVYSAMIAPIWLGLAFVGIGRRPTLPSMKQLFAAAGLAAIPVLFAISPYLARGLPRGPVDEGVDLLAYVSPASRSLLWSWLLPTDLHGREFKGVVGLALMAAGLVASIRTRAPRFRALGLMALAAAGLGVAFSMGDTLRIGGSSYGPGPHRLLLDLFPLEGLRHTPRFNALAVVGSAILVGLGTASWLGRSRAGSALALLLVAVLPFEQWSHIRQGVKLPAAALRAAYRDLPAGPLVDLPPFPLTNRRSWAAYPYFSTYHWNPVPIGRTSFYPPGHDFLAWLLAGFPDANSAAVLSRLGVRTLVVHPLVWHVEERQTRLNHLMELGGLVRLDRAAVPFGANVLGLGDERYFELSRLEEMRPLCDPRAEVEAVGLRVSPVGDTTEDGLGRVLDRESSTRWSSGPDQSGWYAFQVQVDPPQRLAAVVIETPESRFPRAWPSLRLRARGEPWVSVPSPFSPEVAWETLAGPLSGSRVLRMVVRFPSQEVHAFRLAFATLAGPAADGFEVAELRAFRECRP